MKTLEYRTVDKSSWPRGQWDTEPDKKQWKDEATGLPCLIVRGGGGALCGYVGVGPDHPLYEKDESFAYSLCDIDVHGGLTFSDHCADTDDESRHVCHKPEPGEPDHVWWLGFDCSHCHDIRPKDLNKWWAGPSSGGESYKSIGYVELHVRRLASQLSAMAVSP